MKQKGNTKFNIIIITITAILVGVIGVLTYMTINKGDTDIKKQLALGEKYISEGNFDEAIEVFKKVISIDPKCEDAYLGLADAYAKSDRFTEAVKCLDEVSLFTQSQVIMEQINERREYYAELEANKIEGGIPTPSSIPENSETPAPYDNESPSPTPDVTEIQQVEGEDEGRESLVLIEGVTYYSYDEITGYDSIPEYDVVISYKDTIYSLRIHPTFEPEGASAKEDLYFKIFNTTEGQILGGGWGLKATDGVVILNIEQDYNSETSKGIMEFQLAEYATLTSIVIAPIPALTETEAYYSVGENLTFTAMDGGDTPFSLYDVREYVLRYPTGAYGIEMTIDWDRREFLPY